MQNGIGEYSSGRNIKNENTNYHLKDIKHTTTQIPLAISNAVILMLRPSC